MLLKIIAPPSNATDVVHKQTIGALFDPLQGRVLNTETANQLADLQQRFIVGALKKGFEVYLPRFESGLPLDPEIKSTFDEIKETIDLIREPDTINRLAMGEKPELINVIYRLYDTVHQNTHLTDQDKLFFEFLIGLTVIFDLQVQLNVLVAKQMGILTPEREARYTESLQNRQQDSIIHGTLKAEEIAVDIYAAIKEAYTKPDDNEPGKTVTDYESFWLDTNKAVKEVGIEAIERYIVSLRYIPENHRFLGMAQALHWNGFGGNGNYLASIETLKPFLRQCFNYISRAGNLAAEDPSELFKSRLSALFIPALSKVRDWGARNSAAYANLFLNKLVRVLDCGSGPMPSAIKGMAGHTGSDTHYQVTMVDVAGSSMAVAIGKKESGDIFPGEPITNQRFSIEEVRYLDLLGDLSNFGSVGEYDMVSTGVCLHQVMDQKRGIEYMEKVVRFIATVLKEGGLWAGSDAGTEVFLQLLIIASNLTDREGCVPKDIYRHLSLRKVAVFQPEDGTYKLLIRLPQCWYGAPERLSQEVGASVYESNTYIAAKVDQDQFEHMCRLQEEEKFEELESLSMELMAPLSHAGQSRLPLGTVQTLLREKAEGR